MKLSVIVPIYMMEKYIANTIKSLINQTYKEFELILVNDGSTDNSVQIATETLKNTDITYKVIDQLVFNQQGWMYQEIALGEKLELTKQRAQLLKSFCFYQEL